MLDHSEILRLPQLRHQSAATLLDHLRKLQIDFAVPVILLSTAAENHPSASVPPTGKDMGCLSVAV